MDAIIREYRPADWPALCRVHDLARPDELKGSFDPRAFIPLDEDPEREYLRICDIFVAEVAGEVVGFVGFDPPYLAWLYVDPAHYRNGLGRILLRHRLASLGEDAWTQSCGNNTPAIGLYLEEGFRIAKRFESDNAGYPGPGVILAIHPERESWKKPKRSQGGAD